MKISFLVGGFPILSETFILNQITGVIDEGFAVDIYADDGRNEAMIHPDVKKYKLIDKCHYTPKGKLRRLVKGIGVLLSKPRLIKTLNIFKYGKGVLSLRVLFIANEFSKREDYDVVYCHFGDIGNMGAILKDAGIIKGKLITTFHGNDITALINRRGDNVFQLLFKKGDLFLPISENWKRKLIELGCDERKIQVHRMGIDTEKFTFKSRDLKKNEAVKLVSVARLVEKKGIEYGIRAVANVISQYPNMEYRIVGDGPLRTELQALINQLGIGKHVQLLGWREQDEVIQILQDAHIFLAPSVTASDGDQEGIPVVLMESLSMGIPVISTLHSGIPELIQHEISGYLVPERDTQALAETIKQLTSNHDEWLTMGQKGREYVDEHYNIHTLNNRLIKTFKKVI
ncbi:MAG: glycosyltransferase [Bacillota bacterium]